MHKSIVSPFCRRMSDITHWTVLGLKSVGFDQRVLAAFLTDMAENVANGPCPAT
jgi:hypothetical protein